MGWEQSFNRVISVSGGIGLSFSGASWEGTPVTDISGKVVYDPPIDAQLNLTYITIPAEARLMLPLNSGGFCFSFGPQLALLAGARFENIAMSEKTDERSLFNPLSMGLGGSFGGEIQLRRVDLIIDLRIDSGLTNESKNTLLDLRRFNVAFETGVRLTRKRHATSTKWPL